MRFYYYICDKISEILYFREKQESIIINGHYKTIYVKKVNY